MRVIGVDSASKRDLVLDSGAELFIDHLQGHEDELVKAATDGLGAQAVLVLTAANSAYASGMSMLRFGGEKVVMTVAARKFYERCFAGSGKLGAVLVPVDLRPKVLL